jgi:hypothetical protein
MNLQYLLLCSGLDYIHNCCHVARIDILVTFKEKFSFQSHKCPLSNMLLKLIA